MAVTDEKGFWVNGKGEATHPDMIRPDVQLKEELIDTIIGTASGVSKQLLEFKEAVKGDIDDFFVLLLQKYNLDEKSKSKKGNLTLENYSATKKIQLSISDTIQFDEKIQIAKIKVDEYLTEKTKDADPEIRTLITKAFEVDKQGNIDPKKVFALKAYEISDPRWREAMEIIDESKKIHSSKAYIRFYVRENPQDEYKLISLDIASV